MCESWEYFNMSKNKFKNTTCGTRECHNLQSNGFIWSLCDQLLRAARINTFFGGKKEDFYPDDILIRMITFQSSQVSEKLDTDWLQNIFPVYLFPSRMNFVSNLETGSAVSKNTMCSSQSRSSQPWLCNTIGREKTQTLQTQRQSLRFCRYSKIHSKTNINMCVYTWKAKGVFIPIVWSSVLPAFCASAMGK